MDYAKQKLIERLQNDGMLLQYHLSYSADIDVVKAAIGQNPAALVYACEELQNNKDLVLPLMHKDGMSIRGVGDKLRNNFDVVLAAVTNDGHAIMYASTDLKNNDKIIEQALMNNGEAVRWLDLENISKNVHALIIKVLEQNGRLIKLIDPGHQSLEMILSAVHNARISLLDVDKELSWDPRVLFVYGHSEQITKTEWPTIKQALLKNPDMFLEPPEVVQTITEGIDNGFLYRAQYALSNIKTDITDQPQLDFIYD